MFKTGEREDARKRKNIYLISISNASSQFLFEEKTFFTSDLEKKFAHLVPEKDKFKNLCE